MITVPLPSDAYREMEKQICGWAVMRGIALAYLAQPLNCCAIFYREKDLGDAVGYYQGLADALEAAGVVTDDKWIVQWDGSRLRKDKQRPRIEVTLTAVSDG